MNTTSSWRPPDHLLPITHDCPRCPANYTARCIRLSEAADGFAQTLQVTASVVSADRLVFNINGNDYRLVLAVDFEKGILWFEWIGARAEHDQIDVMTVTYEKPKALSK